MWLTGAMGLLCAAMVVVLYTSTGGWKQYGGLKGIFRWLRSGALANPQVIQAKESPQAMISAVNEEVVKILEDIYMELRSNLDALERTMDERVGKLEERFNQLEEMLQKDEPHHIKFFSKNEHVVSRFDDVGQSLAGEQLLMKQLIEMSREEVGAALNAQKPEAAETVESPSFSPRYFEILDALTQGLTVEQAAQQLSLPVAEVLRVEQALHMPPTLN
ncbi:response regulator transcription factor [Alicyclobacillus sp. TC]|uniref:response regulator transcription factor n=1 Tax=Alicyclobacillus sp. TC TaxID=2606450 RepID=UPI0019316CE6|nr:response regulator transcription factor [Alicyclobacillus sp. TC]QRF23698.1 response regulator transcription factor [Alicyclobacillus sp. TC]